MHVEIKRYTQAFDNEHDACVACDTLNKATERTWRVVYRECVYHVEMEPLLKVPGAADLEEVLQSAFEQYVGMNNACLEDGDLDFRDMQIEVLTDQLGFQIRLPQVKKVFGILIEERDLP